MQRTRQTTKLVSSGLGLIVLVCLWLYLAPVGLGGSTSYVVTDGISMEPRFHAGDLALVRSQSNYRVGEIVAYRSKLLHTIVLHRIIGRVGARYMFKGDNNNFVDFEHPARSQLIGALWLHIPSVGTWMESLRSPALIGALVAIGTLLFTGTAFTRRRRRRRRGARATKHAQHPPKHAQRPPQHAQHPPKHAQHPPKRPSGYSTEHVPGVLAVGLLALLPFLALALLAFTHPTTARTPISIPYGQSGALSYSADATPGPAYPDNRAVTGDPLFTHVLTAVDLRFAYRFHTAAPHALAGTASLDATVASTSGWQTTLELGRPTYFHGDRALVTGKLDLTSLLALLHSVETTTAVNGSYTLTLLPRVSASGRVGTLPLHTTFSPRVQFTLNQLELQPASAGDGASAASAGGSPAGGQSAANPFAPSAEGSVAGRHNQTLSLSLGFARPSVARARLIALGAIAVLICALLVILVFVRPPLKDESAAIRARYGQTTVPVAHVSPLPGVAVIDVADMDALVRIAEHYDRSILREAGPQGEAFWVTDESGQFRYAVGVPAHAEEEEEEERIAESERAAEEERAVRGERAAEEERAAQRKRAADEERSIEAARAMAEKRATEEEWTAAGERTADRGIWVADEDSAEREILADSEVFDHIALGELAGEAFTEELELDVALPASEIQAAEVPAVDPDTEYGWTAHTAAGAMARASRD
jgi:signal peptidase I